MGKRVVRFLVCFKFLWSRLPTLQVLAEFSYLIDKKRNENK
ncbi:hypothetical protein BGP_6298 [Beggiatoa sp. PS]|nr:hypothetical protein BGP_6298 [Beggiatoa sp. PS]